MKRVHAFGICSMFGVAIALVELGISSVHATELALNLPELETLEITQPDSTQSSPDPSPSSCLEPALSRLTRHAIAPGETLDSIAAQYGLLPATLLGFNPSLRDGSLPIGTEILIPPFNGIQATAPAGSSWADLANQFGIRSDVLFEMNGCQDTPPSTVFVPGITWSPTQAPETLELSPIEDYPLPEVAPILYSYGWQVDENSGELFFNSGVDLIAELGTPVLSAGQGTVAFANEHEVYGNLVVVNHAQGLQTRYAGLNSLEVHVGQIVQQGDRLGTVGVIWRNQPPHLHFEVRMNSNLGWIAQDPSLYIPETGLGQPNPN